MPFENPHPGYAIWTVGCQMNEADARTIAAHLEAAGFRPVPETEADLVVVTSCVVRQQAEDKVLGRLRHLELEKRKRPGLRIALMGCLVGVGAGGELPGRFPFVDVFLPPSEPRPLLDWLAREGLAPAPGAEPEAAGCERDAAALPPSRRGAVSAHVPAVLGCSHACAYCVIPQRRGRERSRPRADILREASRLAGEGVREIVLLGQIVDRYGRDLEPPLDLADLLRDVAALDGLDRVRFLTSHPSYFPRSVLDAVADCSRICPHFVIPIQSGHDAVLARMRRGYTVDDYRRLIGGIRDRLPEAAIHTDLIVGFPGETEEQFDETARRVEEFRFGKIHLAKYSPRPGTTAARRYPDDVSAAEKERRRLRIEDLQRGIQEEANRRLADRIVEALIEEADERRPGRWRGRTRDDRQVIVESPENLQGLLVQVRIHWAGPFTLIGKPEPG